MADNVHSWWQGAGKTYYTRFQELLQMRPKYKERVEGYELQEQILEETLAPLSYSSVLEIGCGFGRMTKLILKKKPERYVAIDVSLDQINHAKTIAPGPEFIQTPVEDFKTNETFDLVVASEVLMHIPPHRIKGVIASMKGWSKKYIINADYANLAHIHQPQWAGNRYAWIHDYKTLYNAFPPVLTERLIGTTGQSLFLYNKTV